MTKTCKVCGVTDQNAEFYAGVNTYCKECHKEKVRQNRKDKAEYYREYDKKRFQNDPRVKERHKRYQATEAGKASDGGPVSKHLVAKKDGMRESPRAPSSGSRFQLFDPSAVPACVPPTLDVAREKQDSEELFL